MSAYAVSCGASIIGMEPIGSRNPTHFQSAWDFYHPLLASVAFYRLISREGTPAALMS
jgi:hypothetical protein